MGQSGSTENGPYVTFKSVAVSSSSRTVTGRRRKTPDRGFSYNIILAKITSRNVLKRPKCIEN